jgi:hypothetical protein
MNVALDFAALDGSRLLASWHVALGGRVISYTVRRENKSYRHAIL